MVKNKKVLGIITEYDPFHNGHFYQLNSAKKACGADYVVVVMSGPYMQRGTLAMFSPQIRTKMALENGVDLVLELPVLFSLRDAYGFAKGGIGILNALGIVDYLSFGCEAGEIQGLVQIADFLENQDQVLHQKFLQRSDSGKSYVQVQSEVIGIHLGEQAQKIYESPNNMLGLNYIRVLKQLDARIEIVPIKRTGGHNNKSINPQSPSASFIRNAIKQGNLHDALQCLTEKSKSIVEETLFLYDININEFNENSILEKIRTTSLEELQKIPGVAEGFENTLKKASIEENSIKDLLYSVKSRRYTLSRIKRILSYIDLGIKKQDLKENIYPKFTKVLGYRKKAEEVLKTSLTGSLECKLITQPAKEYHNFLDIEKTAYQKWGLASGKKIDYFREHVIKI